MIKWIKTGTLLAAFWLVATPLLAQDNAVSRYFGYLNEDPHYTSVSISSKMFSLFSELDADDPEDQAVLNTISRLNGLRILSSDSVADGMAHFNRAYGKVKDQYEELMRVEKEGQDLLFLIQEQGTQVRELLMLAGSKHQFFVLSLTGDVNLKEIAQLSKSVQIDGLDYLENLDD